MVDKENLWVVQAPKQVKTVKDGSYVAEFMGVEHFEALKIDGPRWKWNFKVLRGEEAGNLADGLTEQSLTSNTQAGRFVIGLIGDIQPGDNVSEKINGCVGKPYLITVGRGPKGGKSAVRIVSNVPEM